MNTKEKIQSAIEQIGEGAPTDYVLVPEQHADMVNNDDLRRILKGSLVGAVVKQYRDTDTAAILAQRRLKNYSSLANVSLFLATGASSLIMVFSLLITEPLVYTTSAALAGFAFAAIAAFCLNMIRSGQMLEGWMKERAEAEMHRLRFFKLVTSQAADADPDSNLPLVLLEYFRRFQLDIQIAFYRERGRQHAGAAHRKLVWGASALGLVSLLNAAAGLLTNYALQWSALAAVALVVQSFATSTSNSESLNQDGRNAERFKRVYRNLANLAGRLDEVRSAVAAGDLGMLDSFVDAVHEGLSAEHRQWTEDIGQIGSAVDKLSEKLKNVRSDLGGGDKKA
jgi:hypothetical protein